MEMTIEEFRIMVKSFYPMYSPVNENEYLAIIYKDCDINNDGKVTLKELVTYFNKTYGIFHINKGKGMQTTCYAE